MQIQLELKLLDQNVNELELKLSRMQMKRTLFNKQFRLGSRIRDMEAKRYNSSHLLVNIWNTFYFFWLAEMALWDEPNIEFSAKVCAHYDIFGL